MARVKGKVALISGAAQGLGRATAILLAQEGASIVATDINAQKLAELEAELKQMNCNVLCCKHDVTQEKDWQSVTNAAVEMFGRLDILVNNAGVALQKNIEDTSLEEWRSLMAVNLDGVFLGTKYGIGKMKKNGSGSIINLSSIEGLIGHPELAAYNASKGGVRLLTKSAALYCGAIKTKIRVNSIHPAFARTPLLDEYFAAQPNPETAEAELEAIHPIGLGEPSDIANGVLYLASDESKWVTGTELVIDGGFTAQ